MLQIQFHFSQPMLHIQSDFAHPQAKDIPAIAPPAASLDAAATHWPKLDVALRALQEQSAAMEIPPAWAMQVRFNLL